MDQFFNFLIILFVILSVIFRVKKATKALQNKGLAGKPTRQSNLPMVLPPNQPEMIVPPSSAAVAPQLPDFLMPNFSIGRGKVGLNNKDLDKIVSVYGQGASLGTDEVSGLLNVTPETAQNYLERLQSQGRAELVMSLGNRPRYKLN